MRHNRRCIKTDDVLQVRETGSPSKGSDTAIVVDYHSRPPQAGEVSQIVRVQHLLLLL